jgi:hypothetical protein
VTQSNEPGEKERSIGRRLEELEIPTTQDEISELASAYDALQAWLRIAEELGGDSGETQPGDEPA